MHHIIHNAYNTHTNCVDVCTVQVVLYTSLIHIYSCIWNNRQSILSISLYGYTTWLIWDKGNQKLCLIIIIWSQHTQSKNPTNWGLPKKLKLFPATSSRSCWDPEQNSANFVIWELPASQTLEIQNIQAVEGRTIPATIQCNIHNYWCIQLNKNTNDLQKLPKVGHRWVVSHLDRAIATSMLQLFFGADLFMTSPNWAAEKDGNFAFLGYILGFNMSSLFLRIRNKGTLIAFTWRILKNIEEYQNILNSPQPLGVFFWIPKSSKYIQYHRCSMFNNYADSNKFIWTFCASMWMTLSSWAKLQARSMAPEPKDHNNQSKCSLTENWKNMQFRDVWSPIGVKFEPVSWMH